MDDSQLESLAIKEIIEELERKKQAELASRQPQERKIRPNSRFLGRTIVSVLQHNRRQNAEERRNSSRKLRELNTDRRRRPRAKSRSEEPRRIREKLSEYRNGQEQSDYYPEEAIDSIPCGIHLDLATIFLNNYNNLLLNKSLEAPKKEKKKKRKSKLLTIDLTKKKKKNKRSKKSDKKSTKSKKRGRIKKSSGRKRSSSSSSSTSLSSSSSDSTLSTISDSNSDISSNGESGASTLMIDLT